MISCLNTARNYSVRLNEVVNLTSREVTCVILLLRGKTAKEIAKAMVISHRTVEEHLTNIKKKVGCWSKSQLISYIYESNFFQLLEEMKHLGGMTIKLIEGSEPSQSSRQ